MPRVEIDGSYKKVVFYLETDRHAQLLLHLKYFDFKNQGSFFRGIVDLFLQDDEAMFEVVQRLPRAIDARNRKQKRRKEYELLKQNIEEYNFSKEEVEDLFSLIAEEERGDLCEGV